MKAKRENGVYNLYKNQDLIGHIKADKNLKTATIKYNNEAYQLQVKRAKIVILKDGKISDELDIDKLWGNMTFKNSNYKITGVAGFKWGTQLLNNFKKPLVKVKNKSQFFNLHEYKMEITDEQSVSELDILVTLYAHLFGSKMKTLTLFVAVMAGISVPILMKNL